MRKGTSESQAELFEHSVIPTVLYSSNLDDHQESEHATGNCKEENGRNYTRNQTGRQESSDWLREATKVKCWVTEAGMRKFRWAANISDAENEDRVKEYRVLKEVDLQRNG